MCNGGCGRAEQIIVIPAQRHPHRDDPATEPFAVDLADLIPAQRRSSPVLPNPVLVRQLAARPRKRAVIDRVTAVIIGGSLVAAVLILLMVLR